MLHGLVRHLSTHLHQGLEKCRICQKLFTKEEILKHTAEIHQDVEAKWKCETCLKVFSRKRYLTAHVRRCHV